MPKEKIIKMDYLKWQLRKDLTGRYWTDDIIEATNRAKGWNALREFLLKQLKDEKEKLLEEIKKLEKNYGKRKNN